MSEKVLFTPLWMEAWQQAINRSPEYARYGKGWSDDVVLLFEDRPEAGSLAGAEAQGFFLRLREGRCAELRYAEVSDSESAPFILSAPFSVWEKLITEKKDPLFMIMSGIIRLEKGSMLKLGMQRNAAKALLAAAGVAESEASRTPATDLSLDSCSESGAVPLSAGAQPEFRERSSYTTTSRGLDFESVPMQLFQKAKQLGVWNPSDIDFSEDKRQWEQFSETEKDLIFRLTAMFMGGEEAVTLDLLPLIQTLAREGRIEEELFLTSFLWEEAKHTEFFALFLRDVIGKPFDMEHYHGPAYRSLFHGALEPALQRLHHDSSARAQLFASLTYNMIVEGTLAETGYEAYHRMLTEHNLLPGLREGIGLLKRDESRHIAFGLYLIGRLLQDNPHLKEEFEAEAARLVGMAIDVVDEIFEPYPVMPFNLEKSWFVEYAVGQFRKRMQKMFA